VIVGSVVLLQVGCGIDTGETQDTEVAIEDTPNGDSAVEPDPNDGDNGTEVVVKGSEGPPDALFGPLRDGNCEEAAAEADELIQRDDEALVAEAYLGRALARACRGLTEAAEADLLRAQEASEHLSAESQVRLNLLDVDGLPDGEPEVLEFLDDSS
jgi:hypothetical protein